MFLLFFSVQNIFSIIDRCTKSNHIICYIHILGKAIKKVWPQQWQMFTNLNLNILNAELNNDYSRVERNQEKTFVFENPGPVGIVQEFNFFFFNIFNIGKKTKTRIVWTT